MTKTLSNRLAEADTLPKLLLCQYSIYGDKKVAMRKKYRGIWKPFTWDDYYKKVKYFSLGLISMGLQRGDKVAILGENQPEWYWAALAVHAAGGIVVGIFTDCTPKEVQYYASHSDSKFLLGQDQEQIDKILEIKEQLPLVEKVIYWDHKGLWSYDAPFLMTFDNVIKLGEEYEKTHGNSFEENVENGKGSDVALMLFTSGTTGLPKAALVTHDNVIKVSKIQAEVDGLKNNDNYVSAISPAWITEWGAIVKHLYIGSPVSFPENAETVQADIRDIGPAMMFFAARQLETMARTIQANIIDTAAPKRFLYNLFLPVAYRKADAEISGQDMNPVWKMIYRLGDLLVYRNLRDKFGMLKAKHVFSGGAAISPDIIRFFRGMGANIKMGYGSSEGGGGSSHVQGDIKIETAGPPCPGVELRLDDNGQLLLKGTGLFKGYYKNDEATAKAIHNGWLQTGDFSHIDDDGHLTVMGRMGDVRNLASGKKFSPDYTEIRLRYSPYLKDALVFGRDTEDYVTAIVNIDKETVGRWAESQHIAYTTFTDLSQKQQVLGLIARELKAVNKALPEHARIKRFVSLNKEFDPDESELTRTRKLRRSYVEQRFKEIIDAMYSGQSEIQTQSEIIYRDGRKGIIQTALKTCTIDEGAN